MKLLKERNLNIALLISMSWHLICMFSISPVLISPEVRKDYAAVSFLGSILERVRAVPEKPIDLDKLSFVEKLEEKKATRSANLELGLPEVSSKFMHAKPDKGESILLAKKDTDLATKLHSKDKRKRRLQFKDVLVAGEAKSRIVLYKPDLPKVPLLLSGFDFDYKATIRFVVSKEGAVKNPECVTSSGSSEIDQIAIRYIRRWQFTPHDQEQTGVVRVKFK